MSPSSSFAQMTNRSAIGAFVIQFFEPFKTYLPPFSFARVSILFSQHTRRQRQQPSPTCRRRCRSIDSYELQCTERQTYEPGSEPWFGSVSPKQPMISPVARRGRYYTSTDQQQQRNVRLAVSHGCFA